MRGEINGLAETYLGPVPCSRAAAARKKRPRNPTIKSIRYVTETASEIQNAQITPIRNPGRSPGGPTESGRHEEHAKPLRTRFLDLKTRYGSQLCSDPMGDRLSSEPDIPAPMLNRLAEAYENRPSIEVRA